VIFLKNLLTIVCDCDYWWFKSCYLHHINWLKLNLHPVFPFSPSFPHLYLPYSQSLIRMTPTDLLISAIAFIFGIIAAYLFFRQQISAIEGRALEKISNAGGSNAPTISGRIPSIARAQRWRAGSPSRLPRLCRSFPPPGRCQFQFSIFIAFYRHGILALNCWLHF